MENYQIRDLQDKVQNVTESDIERLFAEGEIYLYSACRVQGGAQWRIVNDLFPLLKYAEQPVVDSRQDMWSRNDPSKTSTTAHWAIVIFSAAAGAACFAFALHFLPERNELPRSVQSKDDIMILPRTLATPAPIWIEPRPPSNPRPTNVVRRDPSPRPQTPTRNQPRQPAPPSQAIAPIQPPPVAPAETLEERRRRNEFQIPKNQWVDMATHGSPGLRMKVVDVSPSSVTIAYGSDANRMQYQTRKGLEGNNFTTLSHGIIFVDSARSGPGKVILTTDR